MIGWLYTGAPNCISAELHFSWTTTCLRFGTACSPGGIHRHPRTANPSGRLFKANHGFCAVNIIIFMACVSKCLAWGWNRTIAPSEWQVADAVAIYDINHTHTHESMQTLMHTHTHTHATWHKNYVHILREGSSMFLPSFNFLPPSNF